MCFELMHFVSNLGLGSSICVTFDSSAFSVSSNLKSQAYFIDLKIKDKSFIELSIILGI